MKKLSMCGLYAFLLLIALCFASCSSEEPFVEQIDENLTFTANSSTSELMKSIVSNDGSHDNIIDGASCFDIQFPYNVAVHGVEMTVNSENDFKIIETLFDNFETDEDVLDIVFPITITKADYAEVTIDNLAAFIEITKECIEGGADADIECIDLLYPITLFTYNRDEEKTGSVTVENDRDLRRFFAGLEATDLMSIDFPISFELHDGSQVVVNDNQEVIEVIENVKNACDEDDDNDYNDDDFTKEQLDALLVECPWLIKDLFRENIDAQLAEAYLYFQLDFKEDGTVTARDRIGNMLTGMWSTEVVDYRVKVTLVFQFLEDFNLEWAAYEIDENRIKLHVLSGDDKIILKKYCQETMLECSDAFVQEELQNCVWAIVNADGTSYIDELRIDFSNMNVYVHDPNNSVVDEGNWEFKNGTLSLNNLQQDLENYIGDWELIECSIDRFKLQRGEEFLVLEKDCS